MLTANDRTVWLDGWRSGWTRGHTHGITAMTVKRMDKGAERGVHALGLWDQAYLFGELYAIVNREVNSRGTEADRGEASDAAPAG